MTSRILSFVASLAVTAALVAPAAHAQNSAPQTKAPGVEAASQEVGQLLDLAKLYVSQGRFDEAAAMLTRAQDAMTRARSNAALIANRPLPAGVIRVGGNVKAPIKIHDVSPAYPPIAKTAKIQGIVILEVIIDTDGTVKDASVLRSVQLLDQAALDAVRQWKFTPTLLNGVPVSVAMTVTMNFSLPS